MKKIDAWINAMYDTTIDFSGSVALAKEVSRTNKREKYTYGLAASSIGFVAMAAYLYV